jgi:hypothetical protein
MPPYAANTIAGPQNRDETESGICETRSDSGNLRFSSAAPPLRQRTILTYSWFWVITRGRHAYPKPRPHGQDRFYFADTSQDT